MPPTQKWDTSDNGTLTDAPVMGVLQICHVISGYYFFFVSFSWFVNELLAPCTQVKEPNWTGYDTLGLESFILNTH